MRYAVELDTGRVVEVEGNGPDHACALALRRDPKAIRAIVARPLTAAKKTTKKKTTKKVTR